MDCKDRFYTDSFVLLYAIDHDYIAILGTL